MIKHLKPQSKLTVFFSCLDKTKKFLMIIALSTALSQSIIVSISNHWDTIYAWHVYSWIIWFIILLIIHVNKFIKVSYGVNLIIFLLDKIIKGK